MAHDQGLSDDPRLGSGIALCRLLIYAASSGSISTGCVSLEVNLLMLPYPEASASTTHKDGYDPWLIEGNPVLDAVPKPLIAYPGIVLKI
jgi:hypothetical protein